jgi:hypothetical protein
MSTAQPVRLARINAVVTGPGRSRSRRAVLAAAGLASLVFAVVAAVWLAVPATNAFADTESPFSSDRTLLSSALSPEAAAATMLVISALGVVVAVVGLLELARRQRGVATAVGVFGIAQALVIGVGLLNETTLMIAGYVMALTVAVGAVLIAVQLLRTSRVGRVVVVGLSTALVVSIVVDILPARAFVELGRNVAGLAGELGSIAGVLGLAVTALLWALIGGQVARDRGLLTAPSRWVLRNRFPITVLAALGPLPYCLLRLTWLTPWPYGVDAAGLAADIRIWGLLLSAGGWAGLVLTLGLVRPWGEVFPRWVPLVAGRSVPVWAAAGPGAVVAAILCISALPMIAEFASEGVSEGLLSALIFPFWFWGPMLALAVWAYVLHRRDEQVPPEQ